MVRAEALVLGSGAAGLRAAVELKRRDVDVVDRKPKRVRRHVGLFGVRQADLAYRQHRRRGDNFRALAEALGAGGAMDEDTAYVEAVGSARALASLQFMGLPLPQDRLGGVLRYQTDHDEVGRATSCGPRTSRLMVQVADARGAAPGRSDFQPYDWRSAPGRARPASRTRSGRLRWRLSGAPTRIHLG